MTRRKGGRQWVRRAQLCLNGWSHGTLVLEQTHFAREGMILARMEEWKLGVGGIGGRRWAQSMCVCVALGWSWCVGAWVGVISTKSVPYDTCSHGLCLDSVCLTAPHLYTPSLAMRESRWGWGRGRGGYFSATTGALWWQGPGHVTHQGLWWLSLSCREGIIKCPSFYPSISLLASKAWQKQHKILIQTNTVNGCLTHIKYDHRRYVFMHIDERKGTIFL